MKVTDDITLLCFEGKKLSYTDKFQTTYVYILNPKIVFKEKKNVVVLAINHYLILLASHFFIYFGKQTTVVETSVTSTIRTL